VLLCAPEEMDRTTSIGECGEQKTPPKTKILKEAQSQDWGEDSRVTYHTDSDNSENSENEEDIVKEKSPGSMSTSPLTRRLSMRSPSVHIFRLPEINELENADLLNKLVKEVQLFPNPPTSKPGESHCASIPESPVEVPSSPHSKATARWGMVAKFARKLTAQTQDSPTNESKGKVKLKPRRGSKAIPNVTEDQYV
jgi:hypothetical protein